MTGAHRLVRVSLVAVTAVGALLAPSFASSAAPSSASDGSGASGGSKGTLSTTNVDDNTPTDMVKLDQIQKLGDLAEASPTTYAGISTAGEDRVTVHVVDGAALPAAARTVMDQLGAEGSTATWDFQPRSLAELTKTFDDVTSGASLAALGRTFVSAGIDSDSNTVSVGLNPTSGADRVARTSAAATRLSQMQVQYGDSISFYNVDKPIYAASRTSDTAPSYGGDGVFPSGGACASGFAIQNA